MTGIKRVPWTAVLLLILGCTTWAQKPNIANAKLQEVPAGANLKSSIDAIVAKEAGPVWIGYRIPAQAKERTMCCWDSGEKQSGNGCCLGCRMDSQNSGTFSGTASNCAPPEPVPYAFVFLKYEGRQVSKVRVFSKDCPLDFAGLPLYWLDDVKPEQSVELLLPLAQSAGSDDSDRDGRRAGKQAVMAIAFHDIAAADQALRTLIQPNQPLRLREDVAFWLGVERGKPGLDLLRETVKADPDERFREKATFAISQSKQPEAVKDLIAMAHNDPSSRVRGQAIFWLAQIGGRKEAGEITDAIENDPDTQVKKKAVFALSQIHNGEGVPLLINVARTNKNPAVRKQAIFWLGQSQDPRALNFLEEIITK